MRLPLSLFLLGVAGGCFAADDGFISIFNGKDLAGWDADSSWTVRDGTLVGTVPTGATAGSTCVWRAGELDDFELVAQVRLAGAKASIGIRGNETAPRVVDGTRIELGSATDTGSEWAEYRITAQGGEVTTRINGTLAFSPSAPAADNGRHLQGRLALNLPAAAAGKPVEFKDIKLKRLPLVGNRKKIVLLAGKNSHPLGEHEFEAGIYAFRRALDKTPGVIAADYYLGWPTDPTAFANADAVVLYSDGGGGNPAIQGDRLQLLTGLAKKGVGIGFCHYATEVPVGRGSAEFLTMTGGYYESKYSANPIWMLDQVVLADVPLTKGVQRFATKDEWYFNIRFRAEMQGITAILQGTPSDETRSKRYSGSGPYDHVIAKKGQSEVVMWTVDNPGANRGFGYTGGHYHANWANPDVRKLVLNAALWIARAEIPANGVDAQLTDDELNSRLRSRMKAAAKP